MRFLSIAALSGLFISTVCAHAIHDPRSFNLEGRANCPAGTEPSGNRCQDCSAGRFSTGGNSACRACPDGANSGRGDSSCTCQPGYFSSNGRATDNPCTPCASGSVSGTGSRSCQQCEPNTYANGGTCSPCPDGYTSGPGASSCTPRCQAGSYYSSNQCRPCSAGSYSNAGATSCTSCPSDTFSRGNGASACEECPSGSTSGPGSSSCKPINCSAGKYGENGSCQTCPAGTYSGPNASSCSDCPAGSVSDSGSQSCTPCSGGYVPASNGKTCTRCDRNTYSNGDTCSPCPNGYTSNPGSSSCGPQPSRRAQPVMVADSCAAGFQSCPVFSGRGGTECINPLTTLDSCGGCVAPEGEESSKYTGRDCSAIPHVDQVKCHRGKCEITSCRPGYEPSGNSCVEKSGHDGKNGTLHTRSAHGRLAARHHGSL